MSSLRIKDFIKEALDLLLYRRDRGKVRCHHQHVVIRSFIDKADQLWGILQVDPADTFGHITFGCIGQYPRTCFRDGGLSDLSSYLSFIRNNSMLDFMTKQRNEHIAFTASLGTHNPRITFNRPDRIAPVIGIDMV